MYRIVYEYGHLNAFPRYFDPAQPRLSYADSLKEARQHISIVIGRNRKADLRYEQNPEVVERRRNSQFIATILDQGTT